MSNDEREAIRKTATQNGESGWQKNTNPYDNRDVRHTTYNDDYKSAGGKN